MARLFVLIKRKGSKRFLGAIPAKKGATKAKLTKSLRKKLKKGFSFTIVNSAQLRKVIVRQRHRTIRKIKRRKMRKRRR